MAARTGASIGVGITITILGLLTLTLFVLTLIFYGQMNRAKRDLQATQDDVTRFVRADERERDDIRVIADDASSNGKSVVAHLRDELQGTMNRVTGLRRETLPLLEAKLDQIEGAGPATPLLEVIDRRDRQIARLTEERNNARDERDVAQADLSTEVAKISGIEARHDETVATLNSKIEQYREEVDRYRQGVQLAEDDYDRAIDVVNEEAAERVSEVRTLAEDLERDNLVLQDQIKALRADRQQDIFRGDPEEALVDGRIVAVNGADGTVSIGRGLRDKVVLGMTFSVYPTPAAIRPNAETGEYPDGKASIEVIDVDQASSTCRILFERAGNPIVSGDIIANPVYDPRKVYTFVVFGNFDVNRDGRATPQEASEIRALVAGWGGELTDELTGNVDFVVLGDPPVLPPQPPSSAPIEVIQQYVRLSEARQRYDELQQGAQQTSVPVLNENRLYTLLGRRVSSRR
ncbi:MAG: hypothetical protein AAGK04_04320 [Planctomycetota bacterium]